MIAATPELIEEIRMLNKAREDLELEPYTFTSRKCLKCQKEFESWGIENRICHICKEEIEEIENKTAYYSGYGSLELTISDLPGELEDTE